MIRVLGRDWRATPCPLTKWRTWYHPGTWRISQEGKKTSTDLLHAGGWALPKSGLCSDPPHEVLIALKPTPLGFTLHSTNHSVLFMGWGGRGHGQLYTFDFPLGQSTFHASFFFFGWRGRVVKGESSQVPDMFLKEFPRAPHFYSICFDKKFVLISSIQVGQTGGILHFKIQHSILRTLHNIILFEW